MSKHVFIGNTRILSQVEHGANAFNNPTSGTSGGGSSSGGVTGGGVTIGDMIFVTVTQNATVYEGANQTSQPLGTASTGDVLEVFGTGNGTTTHNSPMEKVLFDGLMGFSPVKDVTAGGTPPPVGGGGGGGSKGGGGSTGTSTSVLPK